MTNPISIEEQIKDHANHFILSVYENQKNGRNSIRAGIKLTKNIEAVLQQEKDRLYEEMKREASNYGNGFGGMITLDYVDKVFNRENK